MGQFLIRTAFTGVALWLVTLILPGSIQFVGGEGEPVRRVVVIFVIAAIFGLVNAVIKPIVQVIAIPLYVMTLGLIHVVINALMLWLVSWMTEGAVGGLHVTDFWWSAIWAAIMLSIVSWVLALVLPDGDRLNR